VGDGGEEDDMLIGVDGRGSWQWEIRIGHDGWSTIDGAGFCNARVHGGIDCGCPPITAEGGCATSAGGGCATFPDAA
jgi:hypothetical protein